MKLSFTWLTRTDEAPAFWHLLRRLPPFPASIRLLSLSLLASMGLAALHAAAPPATVRICPPYWLKDEKGQEINPVKGINAQAPYSPRQTCGAAGCHDYDKITQGYHFTQGKGEAVPEDMAARYPWVSSPGNFGGTWCSPAPLYRFLAPKSNASPVTIDMTAATFITAGCG
jgi:hypothetical protein